MSGSSVDGRKRNSRGFTETDDQRHREGSGPDAALSATASEQGFGLVGGR